MVFKVEQKYLLCKMDNILNICKCTELKTLE